MCNCVKPGLTEDQPANNFVEVYAVIQRQLVRQAHVPEERHQVAEDEDQADHRVEQYGPTYDQSVNMVSFLLKSGNIAIRVFP